MDREQMRRLLREVELAGQCSHPIRLRGEALNLVTGEVEPTAFKVACKDRREAVCPACSRRYATDAWIIAATGLNGGKGVDESVSGRPRLFVTLTAPSFGSVHTINSRGGCVTRRTDGTQCPHGSLMRCEMRHVEGDSLLGQALCADCFDFRGAILWNATASRLWASTIQQARRNLASRIGVQREEFRRYVSMHYFKVAEMQRRGLVHFHALLRLDEECKSEGWKLDEIALSTAWKRAVEEVGIPANGGVYRWGRIADVQNLGKMKQDARMVATYLAKYVTKTSGDALELSSRFASRREIDFRVKNPHLRRMAHFAWEMGEEADFQLLRLREHAHTLGFSGQLITKSRAFSTTFGALRQARIDFTASLRTGDPVAGSFQFEGRGYDDPKASILADTLSDLDARLRAERVIRETNSRGLGNSQL
jgi:hypothetical protein